MLHFFLNNLAMQEFRSAERNAHWPGAAASDVAIGTKLNRLLPVQCSAKLANRLTIDL
jgi:hypothetical protein